MIVGEIKKMSESNMRILIDRIWYPCSLAMWENMRKIFRI